VTREGGLLSYDYVLSKGDAAMGIEDLVECAANGVIGTVDVLKASITGLFPSVHWEQSTVKASEGGVPTSWFGRLSQTQFHFMPEPDGKVRLLFMSGCERSEVAVVARNLGLVAVDEQTMEVLGG
jgi:hypothetical protein